MTYSEVPPRERHERARRIDFAMRHHDTRIDFGAFMTESSTAKKAKIRNKLTKSARLTTFLHAALLIRSNYPQWTKWLNDPSKIAPKVFESFSSYKLLVFYLYFCGVMKTFHLDPRYPFLVCEQRDTRQFIINGPAVENIDMIRSVIDVWISIGSPWKESKWGIELMNIAQMLMRPDQMKRKRSDITISWNYRELTRQFGFDSFLSFPANKVSIKQVYLDMPSFVREASIAVAFDSGINTFEIIYELFPQFPEFISNATRVYYCSIVSSQMPTHEHETSQQSYEKMLKNEKEYYPIAREILTEMFETNIWYDDMDENIPLRNQSILDTIQLHPELFTRWATDPKMRRFYRERIDQRTLFD